MFVFATADGADTDLAWAFAGGLGTLSNIQIAPDGTQATLTHATLPLTIVYTGSGLSIGLFAATTGTVSSFTAFLNGVEQFRFEATPSSFDFSNVLNGAFDDPFQAEGNALYGGAGAQKLRGGAQGDTFVSSAGNDTLLGEDGADTFFLYDQLPGSTARAVQVQGGNGFDTLSVGNVLSGSGLLDLTTGLLVSIERVQFLNGSNLRIASWQLPAFTTWEVSGDSRLEIVLTGPSLDLSAYDPTVYAGTFRLIARGGAADETILAHDTHASQLFGGGGNDSLAGLGLADRLFGGSGNDTLDGGAGRDTMEGGKGNDTYLLSDPADRVIEEAGGGRDLALAPFNLTLMDEVEDGTLTGTADLTLTGNALRNLLTGNSGANRLSGGEGNDTLDGGTGADTMLGGRGDDRYLVDHAGDVVAERAAEGVDWVTSTLDLTLGANVENGTLAGAALVLKGNALANRLTGNAQGNTISGGAGNDQIYGEGGADRLSGGTGDDTLWGGDGRNTLSGGEGNDLLLGGAQRDVFVLQDGGGNDRIGEFTATGPEADRIDLRGVSAITDFADLAANHMRDIPDAVRIDLGGGAFALILWQQQANLDAGHFLF